MDDVCCFGSVIFFYLNLVLHFHVNDTERQREREREMEIVTNCLCNFLLFHRNLNSRLLSILKRKTRNDTALQQGPSWMFFSFCTIFLCYHWIVLVWAFTQFRVSSNFIAHRTHNQKTLWNTHTRTHFCNTHIHTHQREIRENYFKCDVWTNGQPDGKAKAPICAHRFFSIDYYRLLRYKNIFQI